jgi:hypothetical protein
VPVSNRSDNHAQSTASPWLRAPALGHREDSTRGYEPTREAAMVDRCVFCRALVVGSRLRSIPRYWSLENKFLRRVNQEPVAIAAAPETLQCCQMVATICQRLKKLFPPTWRHHHLMIASTIVLTITSSMSLAGQRAVASAIAITVGLPARNVRNFASGAKAVAMRSCCAISQNCPGTS